MARRYFNWKLAFVLLIGLVVLGITAYGLRRWQRSRRAEYGLEAGNKAYNEHKWEDAAKYLGRYLAVAQDDVSALLKYADAQLNIRPLKHGSVRQAIAAYRTVLRIDKSNSEAAMRLTEIYLQMGMPGEAELITTRALEANQSPELQRMLAIALANQRKFKDAEKELKSIIKEHPEQILAYGILGQLIEQRPDDFLQAPQFWFDEVVKNNPSSAHAYIIRAAYHLRHNDKTGALADLTRAEQKDLSEPAIRLQLAEQFINVNSLDKAKKHLEVVQASEPANQLLWQTWARLALKSNSKVTMLKVAGDGLKELSSQPWDFMPIAAELYIRCDELDLASGCISRLREKDIVPATTVFLEGLLADKTGNGYEAVKYWNQAIQLGAEPIRTRLALAGILSRLGNKQSAIRQLHTVVSKQPNLFSGRLNLARLLTETGNWAEAAEQARLAMQISPDSLNAALLHIQAQIQLAAERQIDRDSLLYQDLEDRLARLEKAANGALEVKLLQFQLAMQQGDFAHAEMLVTQLKKAHPSQINVEMAEVGLLAAQNKTEQAISVLENIVEQSPQAPEPVESLAILLARQDERQKCEDIIKNALARIEEPVAQRTLYLLLADLYQRWGQRENEYELLNLSAEKLPNDVPIKRRLLACAQVVKNPEKTQQLISDIKSLEGEDGWQWRYEQTRVWFAQDNFKDQYPQIISLLKENLLANPDDQASRMLLAHSYERAGELRLAISTYQEALNRSPQDLHIIIPAVAALYKANEYDRADGILHQAANEKLFHPELKRLELQSYLRHGELSSASGILEDLLANDPNNQSICLSLALLKMRQDKFTEADQLLSKLKAQEPNLLPIIVAQIQSKVRQNKSDDAIRLCDEIINKFNDASAYILRGRTYASLGQAEEAEKDFEHATIIEPNNARPWAAKSHFYRSTGQFDKAIASIRRAMSLEPDNVAVCKRAVPLFLATADPDTMREGRNILDKALTSNPEDIELCLYKARSLLIEGTAPNIKQATAILQKITEDRPNLGDAWALWAETTLRQGEPAKAMDIALRGLAHRPEDKALLLLKARAEAVRSPTLAIPTLKAMQELDPNDVDTTVLLANTYITTGKPQKAVNLLEKQIVSCGGTAEKRKTNIALAVALHKNGSKLKSQEIFDSLYQSAPDDPSPLLAQARLLKDDQLWQQLNRMVLHWSQNHPDDTLTPITVANDLAATESTGAKKVAEELLRKVLQRDPNSLPAISTLAILLQKTGRSTEAATLYQRILTLQPDNVIAMNNLAWILCEEQRKYQQALELAHRGLEKSPRYVDLIDTRGVAYYRLGEFDKAVQDFKQCVNLYPTKTPSVVASYFHLAKALARLGRKGEAIENLTKTLNLNNKIGGLSDADFAEAQRLLKELSEGV